MNDLTRVSALSKQALAAMIAASLGLWTTLGFGVTLAIRYL